MSDHWLHWYYRIGIKKDPLYKLLLVILLLQMLNTAICDMYAHRIKQVVISRWDRISIRIINIEAYQ